MENCLKIAFVLHEEIRFVNKYHNYRSKSVFLERDVHKKYVSEAICEVLIVIQKTFDRRKFRDMDSKSKVQKWLISAGLVPVIYTYRVKSMVQI